PPEERLPGALVRGGSAETRYSSGRNAPLGDPIVVDVVLVDVVVVVGSVDVVVVLSIVDVVVSMVDVVLSTNVEVLVDVVVTVDVVVLGGGFSSAGTQS